MPTLSEIFDKRKIFLYQNESLDLDYYYPMRRKTPCFSYGDIRRVHRIYASN